MNVIFEICDWKDYNPLDGEYNPKGYTQEPVYLENFKCRLNEVITPFMQSYKYLVIGFNPIYQVVKMIPYCNFAKEVFERQYKNFNNK
jgi:hypothetical protein